MPLTARADSNFSFVEWDNFYASTTGNFNRWGWNPEIGSPTQAVFIITVFEPDPLPPDTLPVGAIQGSAIFTFANNPPLKIPPQPLTLYTYYDTSGDGIGINSSGGSVFRVIIFTLDYDNSMDAGFPIGGSSWYLYFDNLGATQTRWLNPSGSIDERISIGSYWIYATNDDPLDLTLWEGTLGGVSIQYGTGTVVGNPSTVITPGLPVNPTVGFQHNDYNMAQIGINPSRIGYLTPFPTPVNYILYNADGIVPTDPGFPYSEPFPYEIPDGLWNNVLGPTIVTTATGPVPAVNVLFMIFALNGDVSGGNQLSVQFLDINGVWVNSGGAGFSRGMSPFLTTNIVGIGSSYIPKSGFIRLASFYTGPYPDVSYSGVTMAFPNAGNITLQAGASTGFLTVYNSLTPLEYPRTYLAGSSAVAGARVVLPPKTRLVRLHIVSDNIGATSRVWEGDSVTVPAGIGSVSGTYSVTIASRIFETFFISGTTFVWRRKAFYTDIDGDVTAHRNMDIQIQTVSLNWVSVDRVSSTVPNDYWAGAIGVNLSDRFFNTNFLFGQTVNFRIVNNEGLGPYTVNGLTWGFYALADTGIGIDIFENATSELLDPISGDPSPEARSIAINALNSFAYGDEVMMDLGARGIQSDPPYFPLPNDFYGFSLWAQPLNNFTYMSSGNDGITLNIDYEIWADDPADWPLTPQETDAIPYYAFNPLDDTPLMIDGFSGPEHWHFGAGTSTGPSGPPITIEGVGSEYAFSSTPMADAQIDLDNHVPYWVGRIAPQRIWGTTPSGSSTLPDIIPTVNWVMVETTWNAKPAPEAGASGGKVMING